LEEALSYLILDNLGLSLIIENSSKSYGGALITKEEDLKLIAVLNRGALHFLKDATKRARKKPLAQITLADFVSAVKAEIETQFGCSKHPFKLSLDLDMSRVNDAVRELVSAKLDELGETDVAMQVIEHEREALVPNATVHKIADVAVEQLRRAAGISFADKQAMKEAA
jgi:hypothetical protein